MEFNEFGLPPETAKAISDGVAVVKGKFGNFCVVDSEDASLFDILPLVFTKYGFALSITCRNGKVLTTNLTEILKRVRGRTFYKNGCLADLRKVNLTVHAWGSV